jgi:ketosteroid isomerase-like protein
MKTAFLAVLLVSFAGAGPLAPASAGAAPPKAPPADFEAFLDGLRRAQAEFVQSRPRAFKDLWSRAPDVTIFGGFGAGEHGWEEVGPRLDWASAQFSAGTRTHEVISSYADGDLGYLVQREKVRFEVPGRAQESQLELRVTMIFRRESAGWKIVHRHADSQMTRQGPR